MKFGLQTFSPLEQSGMHLGEVAYYWGANGFRKAEFIEELREPLFDALAISRLNNFYEKYVVEKRKGGSYFVYSRNGVRSFLLGRDKQSALRGLLDLIEDEPRFDSLMNEQ